MHHLAAGHLDALAATMAPVSGYLTIEEVVGFHLSHWARLSGGYSPHCNYFDAISISIRCDFDAISIRFRFDFDSMRSATEETSTETSD